LSSSEQKRRLAQVEVSLSGQRITKRPLSFRLVTDQSLPAAICELEYPSSVELGKAGDEVAVSLKTPDKTAVLFTGQVYDAKVYGSARKLSLADGYKNLFDTALSTAYRKEAAAVILSDILDAAGITGRDVTCPDVEVPRFSHAEKSAVDLIASLIETLKTFGYSGLCYFFDAENIFRFGTIDDSAVNTGDALSLETGRTIIEKRPERIMTLPAAFRHSQSLEVDGTSLVATRTELVLSARRSYLAIRVKG
jgi:hypothetical protein